MVDEQALSATANTSAGSGLRPAFAAAATISRTRLRPVRDFDTIFIENAVPRPAPRVTGTG